MPEILKLALSRLVHGGEIDIETVAEVEALTSQAIGLDYLSDPEKMSINWEPAKRSVVIVNQLKEGIE